MEDLAKFKYELQHDRKLTYPCRASSFRTLLLIDGHRPLVDDGKPDIQAYNDELAALGSPTWFSIPWLYAECYLYRYSLAITVSTVQGLILTD